MSWTDKQAIKVIKFLRDKYDINDFVETGTYKGINALLHTKNFYRVLTCEKDPENYKKSFTRLEGCGNIGLYNIDSAEFLKRYAAKSSDIPFIYLDAHFYDENLPKGKGKFQVLKELKALKGLECVIAIHDFDNGLGHITYDGISLDLDLIHKDLMNVNPDFNLYTNELASCDIVELDHTDLDRAGVDINSDTLSNLEYLWSEARLTYRGILYATPTPLESLDMDQFGLKEWN